MELTLALLFGIVIGSFLNVCIVRLPHEMSVSFPRSHCPKCKKPIAFYDNVPILSYLILGGRCRHCKAAISIRYPVVEAVSGLISVMLYFKFGLSVEWGIDLAFCGALIVLALIDAEYRILPDVITLNGIWVGTIASVVLERDDGFASRLIRWSGVNVSDPRVLALVSSVFGLLVGGGLLWIVREAFFRIRGIEGMGFGDIKMMAMVGAFLGAPLTLFTIMAGSLLGSTVGLVLIRFKGKTREYELPFGTFLSIAGIFAVLYGNEVVRWYIDRFIRPL